MKEPAILELSYWGGFARAVAVDPETGAEVAVMAPANTARVDLEALALGKLNRRLAKHGERTAATEAVAPPPPKGLIV